MKVIIGAFFCWLMTITLSSMLLLATFFGIVITSLGYDRSAGPMMLVMVPVSGFLGALPAAVIAPQEFQRLGMLCWIVSWTLLCGAIVVLLR
jgi:hypothetical protein